MEVKVHVSPAASEQADLRVRDMRPEIDDVVALLERVGSGDVSGFADSLHVSDSHIIIARSGNALIPLRPADVLMARVEHKHVMLHVSSGAYLATKRLYELEELLGRDFVRISKSAIVNLNAIERAQAGFGGVMKVVLSSGCEEWISRKYLPNFKRSLGL